VGNTAKEGAASRCQRKNNKLLGAMIAVSFIKYQAVTFGTILTRLLELISLSLLHRTVVIIARIAWIICIHPPANLFRFFSLSKDGQNRLF
jgi:hypothetical protein